MPFGRRHAGKGFRGFWFGIATVAIVFAILFIIQHFGIMQ
jgi:hypothetical protein